jgi:hypothetical protein
MINTKIMRYTGKAMQAFDASDQYDNTHKCSFCDTTCTTSTTKACDFSGRVWNYMEHRLPAVTLRQSIGTYPRTSKLAPWVQNAMSKFEPDSRVLQLVKPYSEKLHMVFDAERMSSSGLHDLDLIERIYQ